MRGVYVYKKLVQTSLHLFQTRLLRVLTFECLAGISSTTSLNIQKYYTVLILRLTVLCGHFTLLIVGIYVAEMGSVNFTVRTGYLYKTDMFLL